MTHHVMITPLTNIRKVAASIIRDLNKITILRVEACEPCEPPAKVKHTWNRKNIQFSDSSIIRKSQIDLYTESVRRLPVAEQRKTFLKKIYEDPSYRMKMLKSGSDTKVFKRGSKAINWKNDGEWKCNSLRYIDTIYQAMGKKHWSDKGKHGKQGATMRVQCGAFTKAKNTQCKRKCCINSRFCTQHTNRYTQ
jgi:hypothetical protein